MTTRERDPSKTRSSRYSARPVRNLIATAIAVVACVLAPRTITVAEATEFCVWRGKAPFCAGQCQSGEAEVFRRGFADPFVGDIPGATFSGFGDECITGSKPLCCSIVGPHDEGFCRAYAAAAVITVQEATNNNCGLTGPRYDPSFDVHFGACMAWREGTGLTGIRETLFRWQDLHACLQRKANLPINIPLGGEIQPQGLRPATMQSFCEIYGYYAGEGQVQ